jgi:hypothetical protein
MARQGGRVQLEQSNMRLALNMTKIAKEGFSRAAIEETKYLIENPHGEVREEIKQGVEFPGCESVKPAIRRHPAMLRPNHMAGCLPCQNGTAKNPQTHWRPKATGTPPPDRFHERPPELTPPLPSTPPTPTSNTSGAQCSEIVILPVGYGYLHIAFLFAQFFDVDENTQHDTDFDPDMLTDEC